MDTTKILEIIGAQGAWAILSVTLIFYILKAQEKRDEFQEKREQKYQDIITNMADKLDILTNLSEDIKQIKLNLDKLTE